MKKILFAILLLAAFLASCAPAATPTPAPVRAADDSAISSAVLTVDMYYTFINVASSADELSTPWSMMTNNAQCNPTDKCDLSYFQTKWWEAKALYRIYSCGANTVVVEEMRYPRKNAAPSEMNSSRYWSYDLVENNGLLMIDKIDTVKAPGNECVLALDRVANP